jgi:CRISPR-associated endonuclease/helicase Cas3
MNELWAKSETADGRQLSLAKHTTDVIEAGTLLFGEPGQPRRLGRGWLRFFRIAPEAFDLFARTLRAAAGFHDLGKANDGFQDLVTPKSNGEQAIRHEHLSTLLMFEPRCWEWLKGQPGVDWDIALSAVFTHHLQAPQAEPIRALTPTRKYVQLRFGAAFDKLSAAIQERLGLTGTWPKPPELWTFERSGPGEFILLRRKELTATLEEFDANADDQRKRLLWAVRAGLIAADAAASGLFREDKDMPEWITARFERLETCDACYVQREIIRKRIQQLGPSWKGWHKFQDGAAVQPSRTLLLAPCGAGKTLAAWRWIEEQVRHRPAKRLIFLYPTRATATEGFKDYVAWAPEADASLIHSTASYELDGMFDNPSDSRRGKRFDADSRLFALSFWGKRVFSGTVDQFLAFLQFAYGPVCLLPVLAESVVVIDEVHSFDDKMFSALKVFLNNFDVPVLCMTATLPEMRRRELRQCGLTEYTDRPDDLQRIADADRYAIRRLNSRKEAEEKAEEVLQQHRRVLWVVNRVRVAQELAQRFGTLLTPDGLRTADSVPVLCYHSRFTLDHRKHWHGCVVGSFKRKDDEEPQAVLAVTTQVCEMSLDLDADVLITETAPITSLIQRMGRCNRKNEAPKTIGDVYVYPPDGPQPDAPYKPQDLIGVKDFLDEVATGQAVGQSTLEAALRRHGRKPAQGDRLVQFVVSGPYADGDEEEFRDIDDFARRGILDEVQYLRTASVRRPGLIVPVPKKIEDRRGTAKETRHLVIAKSGYYHPTLGLCDESIGD